MISTASPMGDMVNSELSVIADKSLQPPHALSSLYPQNAWNLKRVNWSSQSMGRYNRYLESLYDGAPTVNFLVNTPGKNFSNFHSALYDKN